MFFNSFRQHLYRFFSSNEYEDSKGMQRILNSRVVRLFHKHGGKSECKPVEFFFYTDTEDKAANLAIELSALNYEIYGVSKGDDDK